MQGIYGGSLDPIGERVYVTLPDGRKRLDDGTPLSFSRRLVRDLLEHEGDMGISYLNASCHSGTFKATHGKETVQVDAAEFLRELKTS
jgi:hypothetical protein